MSVLPDLDDPTRQAWHRAGAMLTDMMTPTLRLGVTGLSRAGKTIFITALIRNLVSGGRLPFFMPEAEGRIERAYLEPQPDDEVPRFDYEAHLDALSRDPPEWPESTRRLSQVRITIEFKSASALRRAFGISRLNLDVVDYPGEWLIDLPLLDMTYEQWCAEAVEQARAPRRQAHSKAWREFLSTVDANGAEGRADRPARRQPVCRLSQGRARRRPRAAHDGPRALPAAGRSRRLAAAHLLSARARRQAELRALLARRHDGAALREL